MTRRNIALALIGLLLGAGGMLLWLSPRPQTDGLSDSLLSATRPLFIPFSSPLAHIDPSPWVTISPPVEGSWHIIRSGLQFSPASPLIYEQIYTITLRAGLPGQSGLPLLHTFTWQFTIPPPPLLFLQADEQGRVNVWQTGLAEDAVPLRLTDEVIGVRDYDAAAAAPYLLVVAEAKDGSLDLVGYDWESGERQLLLDCAGLCENARWQPWGPWVAYEQRSRLGAAAELWLLNSETGQTWLAHPTAFFSQIGLDSPSGQFPRWSADGRYLAYFASEAQLIVILDLAPGSSGEPLFIPATLAAMGHWSPVAPLLAYTEYARSQSQPHIHTLSNGVIIEHIGAELYHHTIVANLVRAETIDLVAGTEYNDGVAAWHPGGSLLAVPRSLFGEGEQIWLMDSDGANGRAVTMAPEMVHSSLIWCPCGRELAYQRSPITYNTPPALWLYDSQSQTHRLLQENAFLPRWRP